MRPATGGPHLHTLRHQVTVWRPRNYIFENKFSRVDFLATSHWLISPQTGVSVACGDLRTSALQASLQVKIRFRTATGGAHQHTLRVMILSKINQTKLKGLSFESPFNLVRMTGLEPAHLAALAPKASVSTISPHPRITEYLIVKG